MNSNLNVIVYGRNLFGFDDESLNQQKLQEVSISGFSTVIFWPLHFDAEGNFYYHDSDPRDPLDPIVKNGVFNEDVYGYLPPLTEALKGDGTVQRLLFSIGGAGPDDFDKAKALLATPAGTQTLLNNFRALINALSLDGFDFDLEVPEHVYDPYLDTVVALTLMLTQQCGVAVTYCPYTEEQFWVDCLAAVFQKNNQKQAVSWLNLQCYSGGAENLNISRFDDWVDEIKNRAPLGIENPAAFIAPGYWSLTVLTKCKPDSLSGGRQGVKCPCEMQSTLTDLRKTYPDINSSFVWNSLMIAACADSGNCGGDPITVNAYADALIVGLSVVPLNGNSPSA